jgi:hypothetical protein
MLIAMQAGGGEVLLAVRTAIRLRFRVLYRCCPARALLSGPTLAIAADEVLTLRELVADAWPR